MRGAVLLCVLSFATGALAGFGALSESTSTRETACRGHVTTLDMPRERYPAITRHIEDSWRHGYPHVLRVHRAGASARRARLLAWWQRRHPQPKGDHLQLDEQPPAMARSTWRADVRPVPERENMSQGAWMGAKLRGVPDGACFRWRFV